MFLFLILLFPIGFLIWCRVQGSENFFKFLLIAFIGIVPSALFCAYKFFFSPFYYLPQDSFVLNFFYLFFTQIFVPLLVLILAFMFINKKDSIAERFENIYPFLAGFYAVFLPFRIISGTKTLPFFLLFTKPLIYFFAILAVSKILMSISSNRIGNSSKFSYYWALVFVVLLPAVLESLWLIGLGELLATVFGVVYLLICSLIVKLKR